MTVVIRKVKLTDLKQWTELWRSYLTFYSSEHLFNKTTDILWQRIHTQEHPIGCFVAHSKGNNELLGFVHYFNHCDTWKKHDVCYLEDLYVNANSRKKGVGERLINAVKDNAIQCGWSKVYWHTKNDNVNARALYDRLTGGADGFISYRLTTSD